MPFSPLSPLRSRALAGLAAALALALAACGGAEGGEEQSEPTVPGGADPADVAVIDDWSRALAGGDVDAAAGFFAIPSVAENGLVYEIRNRGDARSFNEDLPCGARLIKAEPAEGFTIATFELGERPGRGECGTGAGNEASTAFRIVDGEIVEWRRVVPADGDDTGAPPAPSSAA